MTIHHNMIDAIGNTPLIKLKKSVRTHRMQHPWKSRIYESWSVR